MTPEWHSAALEKELDDRAQLLRSWRRWHAEQLEEALAGPHGGIIGQLVKRLRRLDLRSRPELLQFIEKQDWRSIDYEVRLVALHQINTAITRLRERHGLSPFDDGLPGERENMFRTIRGVVAANGSD
jgi:hypothetical protein